MRKCAFWKKFLPQLANGRFDGRSGDFFHLNNVANPLTTSDEQPETGRQTCELECCNSGLITDSKADTVLLTAMLVVFFTLSAF